MNVSTKFEVNLINDLSVNVRGNCLTNQQPGNFVNSAEHDQKLLMPGREHLLADFPDLICTACFQ